MKGVALIENEGVWAYGMSVYLHIYGDFRGANMYYYYSVLGRFTVQELERKFY